MTALDVNFVRAQFPAFAEPSLDGQAFFENAGGSYTCGQVIDRLHRFYTQRKVQPYGSYAVSQLATWERLWRNLRESGGPRCFRLIGGPFGPY